MSQPESKHLELAARAGDPDAQYALSAILAGRGLVDEARGWLEAAAAQDHADALFTISAARLSGVGGLAADLGGAISGLTRASEKNCAAATRMLAALTAGGFAGADGWPEALAAMRAQCEAGDKIALREIAVLAFDAGGVDAAACAMLIEAAREDALAAALVERRRRRGSSVDGAHYSFDEVFHRIGEAPEEAERRDVSQKPRITTFPRAASIELCDCLIGAALPRQQRQEIVDDNGVAHAHPHRTSTGAILGFGHLDIPAVWAGMKMARLADAPYRNGETVLVLRYRPGEEYRPHHDFLGPNEPDLLRRGQRVRTALLYLNDGYEGGETHFMTPNILIAGKAGDIAVFDNVDENGAPDISARHAGKPVKRGEKWLATLWFRDRPYSG